MYSTLVKIGSTYVQTERDQTTRTFAATSGQLLSVRDPQSRGITLTYTSGQLTQITDARNAARKLILTYNGSHIQSVSDGTRTVTYGYNAQGDLATVQDVMNRTTTYVYQAHLLTDIKNALNQVIEHQVYDVYTSQGKVIQQTLQDGRQIAFTYQATETIVTTTGADGKVDSERIGYANNNATTGSILNGEAVLSAGFDGSFSPARVSDGNGHTTVTSYTTQGLPTQQSNALGQTTWVTYDSRNNPVSVTDAQGVTTRYRYDSFSNVISTTVGLTTTANLALTTLTRYQYQASNGTWNSSEAGAVDSRVYEQEPPSGVITRYGYDTSYPHRIVQMVVGVNTALAQTTSYGYDNLGRQETVTTGVGTPLQRVDRTTYNADTTVATTIQNYQDGIFSAAAPDQDIVTTYGYDPLGRPIWVKHVLGSYDVTRYNAAGQVEATARNVLPLSLDSAGQPVIPPFSRTQPDRNVATQYGYDGLGRVVLVTETGILTGSFDLASLTWSQATTRTTRTEYDSQSRPVTVTLNYQPGRPVDTLPDVNVRTLTRYDGAGNPIWQRDALGRWTKTDYDALNRPWKITTTYENGDPLSICGDGSPNGSSLALCDADHNGGVDDHRSWASLTDTDQVQVTQYRADGQVERTIATWIDGVYAPAQPDADRITVLGYDAMGRPTTTTRNVVDGNAATGTSDTDQITMTAYDAVGRMQGSRDALGRWTSQQYDALRRVWQTIQNSRPLSGVPASTGCAAFAGGSDPNLPNSLADPIFPRPWALMPSGGFRPPRMPMGA